MWLEAVGRDKKAEKANENKFSVLPGLLPNGPHSDKERASWPAIKRDVRPSKLIRAIAPIRLYRKLESKYKENQ